MADRALVFEGAQIGVETVEGTPVACNKQLQASSLIFAPAADVDVFAPMGQKDDTLAILNREWSTGAITGRPSFSELQYLLSSLIGAAVITTPATGVTARDWDWTPGNTTPDAPKSLTVQNGQPGAGLADQVAGVRVNGLAFTFSRNGGVDMSGDAIGRAILNAQTLTPTPTVLTAVPIAPGMCSVYADSAFAGLGVTQELRDFSVGFEVGGRYAPIWPLNAALTSFDGFTELKPTKSFKVTLGNDAAGQAFFAKMRAGTRTFFRLEAVGPIIELALSYLFRIDVCAVVSAAPSKADVEGLSTLDWTFVPVFDAALGASYKIKLRNTASAL